MIKEYENDICLAFDSNNYHPTGSDGGLLSYGYIINKDGDNVSFSILTLKPKYQKPGALMERRIWKLKIADEIIYDFQWECYLLDSYKVTESEV